MGAKLKIVGSLRAVIIGGDIIKQVFGSQLNITSES